MSSQIPQLGRYGVSVLGFEWNIFDWLQDKCVRKFYVTKKIGLSEKKLHHHDGRIKT